MTNMEPEYVQPCKRRFLLENHHVQVPCEFSGENLWMFFSWLKSHLPTIMKHPVLSDGKPTSKKENDENGLFFFVFLAWGPQKVKGKWCISNIQAIHLFLVIRFLEFDPKKITKGRF